MKTSVNCTDVKGVKIAYEIFDTVDELVEANRKEHHKRNSDTMTVAEFDDTRWRGCRNYNEAENLAIHGWQDALEKSEFKNFYNKNYGEENKLVKLKNDVVGFAPIVPNVLRGIPNCMINVEKRKVKSKIIHIVYNISAIARYSGDSIMKAGMKLVSAIVPLEQQGFRIKLTAMQDFTGCDKSKGTDIFFINLKNEYKKLDLYSTMFPLMHTAMFRVIGFAWHERSPVCRDWGMGYGTSFENVYSEEQMVKCLQTIFKTQEVKYICSETIMDKDMSVEEIQEFLLK